MTVLDVISFLWIASAITVGITGYSITNQIEKVAGRKLKGGESQIHPALGFLLIYVFSPIYAMMLATPAGYKLFVRLTLDDCLRNASNGITQEEEIKLLKWVDKQ